MSFNELADFFGLNRRPEASAPFPPDMLNDRFLSPQFASRLQENSAFFQNSKLDKFFTSPYYLQNIYGKLTRDMPNSVSNAAMNGPANPLSKEAAWYKDYVNKKRFRRNSNW